MNFTYSTHFGNISTLKKIKRTAANVNPDGLYVYDDDGNLVPVTLEVPILLDILTDFEDSVIYTIYTRENHAGEKIIVENVESLKNSSFKPERKTVFVAHGWMNSEQSPACQLVKNGMFDFIL